MIMKQTFETKPVTKPYRLGIDLGGSKIEAALLELNGKVVARQRVATPQGDYKATLARIAGLIEELSAEFTLPANTPLGIGTPGSRSITSGRMQNCNSTCLNDQPLYEDLCQNLQRPVRLANDADCFALTEAKVGAAQNAAIVFGVILGTGVGGGIVVNGQLLQGASGIAGEWGHNTMPLAQLQQVDLNAYQQDRICYCGKKNCIEAWLSGPALLKSFIELRERNIEGNRERANDIHSAEKISSAEEVGKAYLDGDHIAIQVLNDYSQMLALALAQVINIVDPHTIVLGGGLSNLEFIYPKVSAALDNYVFADRCLSELKPAEHGDSAGVIGAAWLWG